MALIPRLHLALLTAGVVAASTWDVCDTRGQTRAPAMADLDSLVVYADGIATIADLCGAGVTAAEAVLNIATHY